MSIDRALLLASTLAAVTANVGAEEPPLELPVGMRVRVETEAAPGKWLQGLLARSDSRGLAILPTGEQALSPGEVTVPRSSLRRLEIHTGKKRQWLKGLLVGAAMGFAVGLRSPSTPPGRAPPTPSVRVATPSSWGCCPAACTASASVRS
jgi:hypothetical protein